MRLMDSAKQPVTTLAGSYGHPVHPALVAVPIGAWIGSFVFDVASRIVADGHVLAEGSRWLIGLGVLGAVGAALAGLGVGGWLGGTLAFRYGVRVADEATQRTGYVRAGSTEEDA